MEGLLAFRGIAGHEKGEGAGTGRCVVFVQGGDHVSLVSRCGGIDFRRIFGIEYPPSEVTVALEGAAFRSDPFDDQFLDPSRRAADSPELRPQLENGRPYQRTGQLSFPDRLRGIMVYLKFQLEL